jgi:glycosyltransferase involved in cell wall biosynthesis
MTQSPTPASTTEAPVKKRRVSVVIPTRERPAMLRQALASIRALEGPDLEFEICLADNACSAENRQIGEEFGVKYIEAPGKGSSIPRNAALKAATCEYITFLDDDDVYLPGHIRPHIDMLEANPELDGVVGQVIYTDNALRPSGAPHPGEAPGTDIDMKRKMLSGWFPQIGTLVARARCRERYGWFDSKLIGGQDLDWLIRFARQSKMGYVHVPCIYFRLRTSGTYDKLQFKRIGFDRRVFLRHAIPEWRIWRSPSEFLNAYWGTMYHYFIYFSARAAHRAEVGDRIGALRAVAICAWIFPLRTIWHAVRPKPIRRGIVGALSPRRGSVVHKL